jgi:hypothetical protein
LRPSSGISYQGNSAENLFLLLTGAKKTDRAAVGDAVLEGRPIEIKRATGDTLNQVRAVKYIPLVVLKEPLNVWYVVPAHVVVLEVSRKVRGQHTENPFESATLNLNRLATHMLKDDKRLRERTLAAIEESEMYPQLRLAMQDVLFEAKALSEQSLTRVRGILEQYGITR